MIYLLRHGKAVRDDEDRTRPLAPRGRRQLAWLGPEMARRGFAVDRVLYSPKLRARQTAARFCDVACPAAPREMVEGILPGDDVAPWVARVAGWTDDVLIVGHNPFCETFGEALTGRWHRFKTATLAGYARDASGGWTRALLVHPDPATKG